MALLAYPGPGGLDDSDPVVDRIRQGRGDVPNVYRMLLHSPALVDGWVHLANQIRFQSVVPDRARELSILLVADLTGCAYEWHHHERIALTAGLSAAEVQAVRGRPEGWAWAPLDRAVLDFTAAMLARSPVPAAALVELETSLGAKGLVELAATVAYYLGLSHLLIALGIEIEEEAT